MFFKIIQNGNLKNYDETSFIIPDINLNNNSIVLDIGANIGTPCIPLALGLPLAKIIAVEPQRNVFFHLCSNILVNKLLNVVPLNAAIGETKIKNSMIKVPLLIPSQKNTQDQYP